MTPLNLETCGLTEDQITLVRDWEQKLPPMIARKEVAWFLGGIITTGCLAKEDSRGKGPQGRVAIGSCVAYPTRNLLVWLVQSRGMEIFGVSKMTWSLALKWSTLVSTSMRSCFKCTLSPHWL